MGNGNRLMQNVILIAVVSALAAAPLLFLKGAEFSGADSQGKKAVMELRPGYKPWFTPLWEPPGGEVESFLFALQAAIGGGVLGYGLGFLRAKHNGDTREI
jgi:cobalt/nickel transport protein